MRRPEELSPLAWQYEASLIDDDDAVKAFADVEITVDAFRKVFRRRARDVSAIFSERKRVVSPSSTEAVHKKYTDAYLQFIYDGLRLNCQGDVLTWQALHNFLIEWEAAQYAQVSDDQSTDTYMPGARSPSE
jgi:hypothetical protein